MADPILGAQAETEPRYVGTYQGQPITAEQAIVLIDWISFPSGQCIPAYLVMAGPNERRLHGMYWDGDTPIFPDWWPKGEPYKAED